MNKARKFAAVFGIICLAEAWIPSSAQVSSPIQDIFFLTKETGLLSTPPPSIMFEITVNEDMYYKLVFEDKIIKAGLMTKGPNIVHVDSDLFLGEKGPHGFVLEWKAGSAVGDQEIFVDVELHDLQGVVKIEPETREIKAGVSLYYKDRLLALSEKTAIQKLVPELKIPPQEAPKYGYHVPFSAEEDPRQSAFSILDAVGLLYSLGRSIAGKKQAEDKIDPFLKRKEMVLFYQKVDGEGRVYEVQALLTLRAL